MEDILKQVLQDNAKTQQLLTKTLNTLGTTTGSSSAQLPRYEEADDFEDFILKFEAVAEVYKFSEAKKIASLVTAIPGSTFQLLRNLLHPEEFSKVQFSRIKDVLTNHLKPKPLVIPSRHAFLQRKQRENEPLQSYMAALRELCIPCKYAATIMNEMLRDVFVAGLRSRAMLDRIFEEDSADLDKIYNIALAIEKAEASTQRVLHSAAFTTDVHAVATTSSSGGNRPKKKFTHTGPSTGSAQQSSQQRSTQCYACGEKNSHLAPDCRNKAKLYCTFCKVKGSHVESVCIKKYQHQGRNKRFSHRNNVHNIDDTFACYKIRDTRPLHSYRPWKIQVNIQGKAAEMEVDCGSGATFCSKQFFKQFNTKLETSDMTFFSYGERSPMIKPLGQAMVEVTYKNSKATLPIYVVAGDCVPLIGRQWLQELNILTQSDIHKVDDTKIGPTEYNKEALVKRFPEVFAEGIGLAKDFKCSLPMKEGATPIFRKARPVPFSLRGQVEEELDKLVKEGVLEPVDHSQYATPVVPVVQGQKIRLCADYSVSVNPQLEIPQYPIPRIEELLEKLRGSKVFAKLDIRKAFLSLLLSDEAAEILTLNTHKGLYRPKRLMYGCASAPVTWAKFMDRVLSGIPGLVYFYDDMLAGAPTKEKLQEILHTVLQRLQDNGLRLNLEKCQFYVTTVDYLGYKITPQGIEKTSERVADILAVSTPRNVKELKSFLGMISFYGKFFPDMGNTAAPLYEATKKNKFFWSSACETAFQKLRKELASDRVLVHYDPTLPVSLACDAGPDGVGAVLQHTFPDGSERPILYIHKKLSSCQKAYSQIDKEAFAIKWAVEKLYMYLIGREFTLITDHLPLVHIFGPRRAKMPPLCATRLLHYAIFLQNFTFKIVYRKSADHGNADYMSRLPIHSRELGVPDSLEEFTIKHISTLPYSPKEIARESLKDPVIRELIWKLQRGDSLPGQDGNYSLQSGCVLRGLRVYVPTTFRPAILEELHSGHLGIVKCKALARSLVYWPNIDKDIENMCRACTACALHKGHPLPKTTHHWEYPSTVWERIHLDYATYGGKYYLVIVDSHSKWPEVFITPDMTSRTVMRALDSLFVRYGYPVAVVSDNQPSLISSEMRDFYTERGVKLMTSPVYHSATNGLSERAISSLKLCLRTLQHARGTPQEKLNQFLLAYRRAPHTVTGVSPASLFLKREIRTRLDLGRPDFVREVRDKYAKRSNYTCKAPSYYEGQTVAVRSFSSPAKRWSFGTLVARDGDLQWTVLVDGVLVRRHVDHIKSVGQVNLPTSPLVPPRVPGPTPVTRDNLIQPMDNTSVAAGSTPVATPSRSRRSSTVPTSVASSPTVTASSSSAEETATPRSSLSPPMIQEALPDSSPPMALRRSKRIRNRPVRLNL